MSRGIVFPFETWEQGTPNACLIGEIEKTATGDPSIRVPLPALRSRRQRARRVWLVGGVVAADTIERSNARRKRPTEAAD
jgi:hypothetical protein